MNPNCLGDEKEFKKVYYAPIVAGQRQNASQFELYEKVLKTKEFNKMTEEWILRRSKSIIAHKMTKKSDQLVYCKLSNFQIESFKKLLKSSEFICMNKNELLMFISFFLKLANHPGLYLEGFDKININQRILNIFPDIFERQDDYFRNENSGKMQVSLKDDVFMVLLDQ